MTGTEKAKEARLQFFLRRTILALILAVLGFLVLGLLFHFLTPSPSLTVVAFAAVLVVSLPGCFVLPAWVRFFCPYCDRFIGSETAWTCGSCGKENHETRVFSFLSRCQFCGRSPKAFQCPHQSCAAVIQFSDDVDTRHVSFKVPQQAPGETSAQFQARRSLERQERAYTLELLDFETATLEKQMKIKSLKKRSGLLEEEASNSLESRYKKIEERNVGLLAFAEKKRLQYQKDFGNSSELLERHTRTLEQFVDAEAARLEEPSSL